MNAKKYKGVVGCWLSKYPVAETKIIMVNAEDTYNNEIKRVFKK